MYPFSKIIVLFVVAIVKMPSMYVVTKDTTIAERDNRLREEAHVIETTRS